MVGWNSKFSKSWTRGIVRRATEIHYIPTKLLDKVSSRCVRFCIFSQNKLDNSASCAYNSNATISDRNQEIDQENSSSDNTKDAQRHFSIVVVILSSFHKSEGTSQHEQNSTHKINEQFLEKLIVAQIDYKANFVAYQNSEISSHEVGTQNRRYNYGIAHQRSDPQKGQITAKFTGPGQSHYVSIVAKTG